MVYSTTTLAIVIDYRPSHPQNRTMERYARQPRIQPGNSNRQGVYLERTVHQSHPYNFVEEQPCREHLGQGHTDTMTPLYCCCCCDRTSTTTMHPCRPFFSRTRAEKVRRRQKRLPAWLQHPCDFPDVLVGDVQVHVDEHVVQYNKVQRFGGAFRQAWLTQQHELHLSAGQAQGGWGGGGGYKTRPGKRGGHTWEADTKKA